MSRVWEVDSTTSSILDLGQDLVTLGVQRLVLESTSDYWRPFFYLLVQRVTIGRLAPSFVSVTT